MHMLEGDSHISLGWHSAHVALASARKQSGKWNLYSLNLCIYSSIYAEILNQRYWDVSQLKLLGHERKTLINWISKYIKLTQESWFDLCP